MPSPSLDRETKPGTAAYTVDAQIHAHGFGLGTTVAAITASEVRTALAGCIESMDAAAVDAAVLHYRPELCRAAFQTHPDRFRSVILFDPRQTRSLTGVPVTSLDDLDATVNDLQLTAGLVGLRVLLGNAGDPAGEMLAEPDCVPIIDVARARALPVCLLALGRPDVIARIARANPDVTFVVDHLGLLTTTLADRHGVDPLAALPHVLGLATFGNVVVKLTGLPRLSRRPYPFVDIWPTIQTFVDTFGPDRLMWGSDYTHDPEHLYPESKQFLFEALELGEQGWASILNGTARRVFSWL
jgi:predicted TIM-barrel fold metal-dependent hydrolase